VAAFEDGSSSLQAVERHEPDVALLDISMPVLKDWATPIAGLNLRPRHMSPAQ
jgi:CheY-like chemotaxis protein